MSTVVIGEVAAPGLHVMSFNVRRRLRTAIRPADRWSRRTPLLRQLLRNEQPTLLGAQEVLPSQASLIVEALGSSWRSVGRGRDSRGRGEGCPIFFDSRRLELRDWSQLALSDRPDAPGSRSWGNVIPRMLVRAEFEDLATGASFVAVNTHLDPFSLRSRARSAVQIRMLASSTPHPVIVMGDLNSRPGSAPIKELLCRATLRDAWIESPQRLTPEWGTYAGYRPPRRDARRIDWIAVSSGLLVTRVAINTASIGGRWPSDHLPVQAVLEVATRSAAG